MLVPADFLWHMDCVEDWDEKLKVRVTLDNEEPELYFS